MSRHLLCGLVLALSVPHGLQSQVDTTARIMGTAKSTFNGRPLAGVMIAVPKARKFVVTDASGTFFLAGLPVGEQSVSVAYNGRETETYQFELPHGKTKRLAVLLDVDAVDLDPIVVAVKHRDGWNNLAGFYERRKFYGGWGRFWTQEDIQRERIRSVGDLLRRMGITTGGGVPTRMTCPVGITIDGFGSSGNDYEMVLIDDVRGVEWYGGSLDGGPLIPQWVAERRSGTPYFSGRAGRVVYPVDDPSDPLARPPVPVRRCPRNSVLIWTR